MQGENRPWVAYEYNGGDDTADGGMTPAKGSDGSVMAHHGVTDLDQADAACNHNFAPDPGIAWVTGGKASRKLALPQCFNPADGRLGLGRSVHVSRRL